MQQGARVGGARRHQRKRPYGAAEKLARASLYKFKRISPASGQLLTQTKTLGAAA